MKFSKNKFAIINSSETQYYLVRTNKGYYCNNERKQQKKRAEKDVIGNHNLLLRKFGCRPCFVRLISPKNAPKKNNIQKFTEQPKTAGRIKLRRATVDHKLVGKNANSTARKNMQRRASLNDRNTDCGLTSRSVEFSVEGKY